MSGLTLEQRKKLSDLIGQYGISLTRQSDEKLIRKSIEETVKNELRIDPSHFREVATAAWKGNMDEVKKDFEKKLDLFGICAEDLAV